MGASHVPASQELSLRSGWFGAKPRSLHPQPPPKIAQEMLMARPKIDPSLLKTETIGVRVSSSEYDALRAKASVLGLEPATYLRTAALARRLPAPPVPAINIEEYGRLAHLASNLNQLTRLANTDSTVSRDVSRLLEDLKAEVSLLRKTLVGGQE